MVKANWGDHITVAMDGHVAIVTIDRPPHNHVSVEMLSDLADALEAADKEVNIRASVIQSAGKNFCAGADFAAPDRIGAGQAGVTSLYDQAVRLFAVEKPMVAAVQGGAIGAGLGLALVADFRVVSPDARFAANFVKLGYHPGFGITHTLPRLVGEQKAALIMLSGRRIKGDEAVAMGLADELAPLDGLREAALNLAREIAENAPLAVVATRKTLRGDLSAAVRKQTTHENIEQGVLRDTEDFKEGVKSVAERRPGNFVGR